MSDKKIRLALVGKDVSKSQSKAIHTFILNAWGLDCEYEYFSVDKVNFDNTMRRLLGDFDGFNVTIPYKRDVMAYLDEVEGDAFDFGAVNTVCCSNRFGYNTDGVGFLMMTRLGGIEIEKKRILVLGAGGSGRSTAVALKKAGAEVFLYQRNREKLLETASEIGVKTASDPEEGGYDVLINCTGVGMHESEGRSPVTEKAFLGATAAIDLIYTPEVSEFLRIAKTQGLRILNGERMLFYQAYYADCLYIGRTPNETEAIRLCESYLQEKKK